MSYVDTGRHAYCGELAGLPLYHPEDTYVDEFYADGKHLLLGGGSGEHAAAVLDPVSCAVSMLGSLIIEFMEAQDSASSFVTNAYDYYGLTEHSMVSLETELEDIMALNHLKSDFTAWSGLDWYYCVKRAKKSTGWAFDPKRHDSVENWLQDSVGEFVLVSMPTILTDHYTSLESHKATLDALRRMLARSPRYGTILTFPTGYACRGRGETLNDPNMHR